MYGSLKSIYDVLYIPEIESSDLETLKKYIIILNTENIKPHFKPNNINSKEYLSDDNEDYYYKQTNYTCFRCGRKGHMATNCFANKHIKGYNLYKI